MIAAWALTLFALGGVSFGVFLGRSRELSPPLAAAGGGLLSGIAMFWLVPEAAEEPGWPIAFLVILLGFLALWSIDRFLDHLGHSPLDTFAGPLLAAGAIHSFVDGWSVRILSIDPLASIAVPIGLALHKIPEGVALGLVARRSISSPWKAFAASASVECLTLVGAFIEPRADRAGVARFGALWISFILAAVAGSFLFLGVHTVLPYREKRGVVISFLTTFFIAGGAAVIYRRLGGQ
jgi:zinc transporter ZupT